MCSVIDMAANKAPERGEAEGETKVNQEEAGTPSEKRSREGGFRERLGAPAKFSADEFVKAIRVVNDKGGRALVKDAVEIFGGIKKREILGRALAFATELGFLTKEGLQYVISEEGKHFLSANEDDKRSMLAAKLVRFIPYRDALLRMRDEKGRALKKETITQMWSNLAGGGGAKIRQHMTRTFASLTDFAGIIEDSGRTCVLQPDADRLLNGETDSGTQKPLQKSLVPESGPVGRAVVPLAGEFTCPRCNGSDYGVVDEQVVEYFRADGRTIVFLKYTFHCRSCKESFSRHGQTSVSGELGISK